MMKFPNFKKNLHNVIKIMLWKFFLQHQKHHVMENHAMEIHVRRGPTVCRYIHHRTYLVGTLLDIVGSLR